MQIAHQARIVDNVNGDGQDSPLYGLTGRIVRGDGAHPHMGFDAVLVVDANATLPKHNGQHMDEIRRDYRTDKANCVPGLEPEMFDQCQTVIPVIEDDHTKPVC